MGQLDASPIKAGPAYRDSEATDTRQPLPLMFGIPGSMAARISPPQGGVSAPAEMSKNPAQKGSSRLRA